MCDAAATAVVLSIILLIALLSAFLEVHCLKLSYLWADTNHGFCYMCTQFAPNQVNFTSDMAHLMVPSDQMYILGVLYFESQQQADGLQRVRPSVHIVTKEQVVNVCDVPSCGRGTVLLKEPHQVAKLTM